MAGGGPGTFRPGTPTASAGRGGGATGAEVGPPGGQEAGMGGRGSKLFGGLCLGRACTGTAEVLTGDGVLTVLSTVVRSSIATVRNSPMRCLGGGWRAASVSFTAPSSARLPHFHMYAFVPNRLGPAMSIGEQLAEDSAIVEAISGG